MSAVKIPDEVPTESVLLTEDQKRQHTDEMIIRQQQRIEHEISETNPLVGRKEAVLESLMHEYVEDKLYQTKVIKLAEKYSHLRRMRPDGNCFFRALSYSLLENLIGNVEAAKAFRTKLEKSKEKLTLAGFTQFTVEDFYDQFMEVVGKVEDGLDTTGLEALFDNLQLAEYIVVYLRILTSAELKNSAEFYQNFVEGTTLEEFCQYEVEPMSKESDHLQIVAITTALDLSVRVVYMDRGEGAIHDFPEAEGHVPTIHMLYRPGHYDILYAKKN